MRVSFLTASTSRLGGGLFTTITNFTQDLKDRGFDVAVMGFDDEYSAKDRAEYGDVTVTSKNTSTMSTPLTGICANIIRSMLT